MGLFDHFPYTNVHELNLDWLLTMMKALEAEWEAFTAGNSLTFADPMLHDISKTYAKNTIVLDGNGNAYVSLQAVPVGVGLQNGDYWLMVFDYEAFIEKVNKNFTARYYRGSYRATAAMAIGDWLTVDDVLYKATAAIAVDDVLEDGVNITHFTLEDFIKAFMQSANQLIQQYKNDIDASELAFTTNLQQQFEQVLAGATVDSEVINARVGAYGTTYTTLGLAITSQIKDIYDNIAPEFDASSAYHTNTLVNYNGDLYLITVDKAVGVDWSGTNKVAVLLSNSLMNAKLRQVVAAYDCDNLTDPGVYNFLFALGTTTLPANTPYGVKWSEYGAHAIMITSRNAENSYIVQTFIADDGLYSRYGTISGGVITWQSWATQFNRSMLETKLSNILGAVATPFDAASAYKMNKVVSYNGGLYMLTLDKAAGVDWNSTFKVSCTLADFFLNGNDRQVDASYDCNDLISPGSYNFLFNLGTTTLPANTPYGAKWSEYGAHAVMLTATSAGTNYIQQIFIADDGIYTRYGIKSGGSISWLTWVGECNVNKLLTRMGQNVIINVAPTDNLLQVMKAHPGSYTFYVEAGTHDIKAEYEAEYGATFFDDYTGYSGDPDKFMRGLWLEKGCKLIGEPGAILDFTYSGTNTAVRSYFSVIAMEMNNEVNGLTINIGVNGSTRYHIHDDFAGANRGTNIIKNCTLVGDQYYQGSIGGGCGKGCKYIIENNVIDNTSIYGISYHNNAHPSPANDIVIKDNYLAGKIRLAAYGQETDMTRALVTGNITNGIDLTKVDPSDYMNIVVYNWNNASI